MDALVTDQARRGRRYAVILGTYFLDQFATNGSPVIDRPAAAPIALSLNAMMALLWT